MSKPGQHSAALARKLEKEKKQSASLEEYYVAVQRVEDTHTFFLNLYAKIEKHTSCIERTHHALLLLVGLVCTYVFAEAVSTGKDVVRLLRDFASQIASSDESTAMGSFPRCQPVVRSLRLRRVVVDEDCRVLCSY